MESIISDILKYSGLSFCNLETRLANAVIAESGLSDDDATFQQVVHKLQSGRESIEREGRMTGKIVRHERCAAILAAAVA